MSEEHPGLTAFRARCQAYVAATDIVTVDPITALAILEGEAALRRQLAEAAEVMCWYAEQAADFGKDTHEGEDARCAIEIDGGDRARTFLASMEAKRGG